MQWIYCDTDRLYQCMLLQVSYVLRPLITFMNSSRVRDLYESPGLGGVDDDRDNAQQRASSVLNVTCWTRDPLYQIPIQDVGWYMVETSAYQIAKKIYKHVKQYHPNVPSLQPQGGTARTTLGCNEVDASVGVSAPNPAKDSVWWMMNDSWLLRMMVV